MRAVTRIVTVYTADVGVAWAWLIVVFAECPRIRMNIFKRG